MVVAVQAESVLSPHGPLTDVVAAAPGPLCLVDGDGWVRAASAELAELLGVSVAGLLGRPWHKLFDPDDAARVAAFDAPTPLRLLDVDGGVRWVEVSATPVRGGGRLCLIRDVTAQGQTRVADTRLRRVLAHAPVLLFAVDDVGNVTDLEGHHPEGLPRALSGHGADVLGRSVFDVWRDVGELVAACRRALGGSEHSTTFTRNGHHVDASVEPLRDPRGLVTGAVGVLLDVTQQRRLELAVQEWDARLGETERLAVVGSLAGGIAHEINNALTASRLSLGRLISFELARPTASAERQHRLELLQDAREGVSRVEHITRELRDFAGGEDAPAAVVDLRAIVDATMTLAAHEIRHRATLASHLEEVPPVLGREQALRQVFLNLLINAAQSMPEGAADHNRVEVRTRTDEHGNAVVEIEDTGRGIPAGALGRIFEPFFTTRPPGQGLGLGLSVCRDLVTEMGGRVAAESEVERGTRMRVVLPPAAPARRDATAPPAPARVVSVHRRILIIDDDRPVAAAVALELSGDHDVVVAGSGREALEILRRDPAFDVILCDLMMPEMTGMDLFAWLQPIEPALAGRFVFMTGGAFTPRAERFLRETENPRLDKPFHPDELRRIIDGVAPGPGCDMNVSTRSSLGPCPGLDRPRPHPPRSRE
jgi:PAS domain S-box-containing protein